jgi:hypothetical protein
MLVPLAMLSDFHIISGFVEIILLQAFISRRDAECARPCILFRVKKEAHIQLGATECIVVERALGPNSDGAGLNWLTHNS